MYSNRVSELQSNIKEVEYLLHTTVSDKEFLQRVVDSLQTLLDMQTHIEEQRLALMQSIRYEFPVNNNFISESELYSLPEAELLHDNANICSEYDISTGDIFTPL